ncbi:MAG TPA: hypothetical protein VJ887_06295 [Actinomycetota bacterium]|nr:hypothetical protein [Actinomycetota bacterium]
MAVVKKAVRAGAKAGKKVLATDAAQSVVGTVVDRLERLVVDNADDVADTVKARAAKAGGRSPRKSTGRKKTTARKTPTRKKTTARKSAGRKKTTAREAPGRKKTATRKTAGRKKTSTGKPASRKKTSARKR